MEDEQSAVVDSTDEQTELSAEFGEESECPETGSQEPEAAEESALDRRLKNLDKKIEQRRIELATLQERIEKGDTTEARVAKIEAEIAKEETQYAERQRARTLERFSEETGMSPELLSSYEWNTESELRKVAAKIADEAFFAAHGQSRTNMMVNNQGGEPKKRFGGQLVSFISGNDDDWW